MYRTLSVSLALALGFPSLSLAFPVGIDRPYWGHRVAQLWTFDAPVLAQTSAAQTSGRAAWTQPYVAALEAQTELKVQDKPLDSTLSRIEFARWLADFFDIPVDRSRVQPISDLTPGTPDYWAAQALLQAGIMRPFEGNAFEPQGDLTKLEALAIVVRALQIPPPAPDREKQWMALYSDAELVPDVGQQFVAMAGEAGLVLNIPDPAQLDPDLILSRGEGAALLHQALVYRQRVDPLNPPIAQLKPAEIKPPELTATRLSPDSGTVPVGGTLTIEAKGTPKGQARVTIGNFIDLHMTEVEPGLYRASVNPTEADSIASPEIEISLELNGKPTRVKQRYPQLALGNAIASPDAMISDRPRAIAPTAAAPTPPPSVAAPPPIDTPPSLPSATSAPLPASEPEPMQPTLTGIRVEPEQGSLQTGDILTVSVQGEPGATAQFDLGNLAQGLPMQEIQSGVYEGTYAIAETDSAANLPLRVVLIVRGRGVQHQELLPLTINGGTATVPAPPTPTAAAPTTPLPQAPALPSPNPPSIGTNPSTLPGEPLIFETSFSPSGRELRPNDILRVRMRGEQQGIATFRILNVSPEFPMREVSPGVYEGQVRIENSTPAVRNGVLQVALERQERRSSRTSTEPVNINPL